MNNHILSIAQRGDRLLLPQIGNGDLIKRGRIFELFGKSLHARKVIQIVNSEMEILNLATDEHR